jgi:hypothetical protein
VTVEQLVCRSSQPLAGFGFYRINRAEVRLSEVRIVEVFLFSWGRWEIGIGDGTTRRFGPGDVVLADDLTGQGHTTRSLGVPRISATVGWGQDPR